MLQALLTQQQLRGRDPSPVTIPLKRKEGILQAFYMLCNGDKGHKEKGKNGWGKGQIPRGERKISPVLFVLV